MNLAIKCTLTLILLLISTVNMAADRQEDELTLNLQNADITALVQTVSEITGKNFIIDPRVQGKITIISSAPTHPDKLYELFLSVLRVHGFAAINSGDIIKIIPDTTAKQNNIPIIVGAGKSQTNEVSTLVLELQNVSAKELVPILRPLLPQSAHLAAHLDSNILIASDNAKNLDRLRKIVRRIDKDNNRAIEIIRLQHASAAELLQLLSPTLKSEQKKGRISPANRLKIIADERTNSLLLSGNHKRRLEIRALISHLDTPSEQIGDIEVIYLHYAIASELVPILQKLGNQLALSDTERQKSAHKKSSSQKPSFIIEADDNMNAVVIQAPPKRIAAIKSVIHQLDIRRAQVLVEGIIAEVSYDNSIDLGVQWKSSVDSNGLFGATRLTGSQSAGLTGETGIDGFSANPLTLASGLTMGYFRGSDLRGLLQAVSGNGQTNVLSTPTLMTLDNEEAEIVVGQNVPFITGQFTNSTTSPDNPFQTIERKDVGIVLKIKPQINEGDSVKLDIELEISSIDQTASGTDLITNKRSVKTSVLIDDGNIIVLAGLLEDDSRKNNSKIPILGDIPVFGHLFKRTGNSRKKTNLMIFLKPQIIRDIRTSSALTKTKYNFIRAQQQALNKNEIPQYFNQPSPQLPLFQQPLASTNLFNNQYEEEEEEEDEDEDDD